MIILTTNHLLKISNMLGFEPESESRHVQVYTAINYTQHVFSIKCFHKIQRYFPALKTGFNTFLKYNKKIMHSLQKSVWKIRYCHSSLFKMHDNMQAVFIHSIMIYLNAVKMNRF